MENVQRWVLVLAVLNKNPAPRNIAFFATTSDACSVF
jgi:hypothetical protein